MLRDERSYSLLPHNTFGIAARCHRFLEYSNVSEAKETAKILRDGQVPFMVIGQGSNLLLTSDYKGIVIHGAIKGVSLMEQADGSALLTCACGEVWDDVVAWTVDMGFPSLVNLSLIPGEVGASAVQNIGAYGAEASQYIVSVRAIEIVSGRAVIISGEHCGYGYRSSRFKQEWKNRYLITHVSYRLNRADRLSLNYGNIRSELDRLRLSVPTFSQLRQVITAIRRQKLPDPKELGNAGSFFMNPVVERQYFVRLATRWPQMPYYDVDEEHVKIPAAWLIDQCGWKGRTMGRAGVHDRQALVLVNCGGATGDEIVSLCRAIQFDVEQRFGIVIQPEVNIV